MSEPTDRFVLDSNIVSRIVRRDARVILRLAAAIRANAEIYLCPVVYYEVRRDLLDRDAVRQLQEFDRLADALLWVDFERSMWEREQQKCGSLVDAADAHTTMMPISSLPPIPLTYAQSW